MAARTTRSKATAKKDDAKVETPAPEPATDETPASDATASIAETAAALDAALDAENDKPAEPEEAKEPKAGPLEPPAAPEPAEQDQGEQPIPAGELGAERIKHTHGLLIDAATQQPPNPDTLFAPVNGDTGSVFRCTVRLLQVLNPGESWSNSQLLVMPRGQQVSKDRAEQVAELVRSQTAGAELEAVDLTADTPKLGDE